jgi:hypothetical protein
VNFHSSRATAVEQNMALFSPEQAKSQPSSSYSLDVQYSEDTTYINYTIRSPLTA